MSRPPFAKLVGAGLVAVGAWSALGAASAAPPDPETELLREAEAAEREHCWEEATRTWRRLAEEHRGSRLARRAEQRLAWLERHRDEAGLERLQVLQRFRERPARSVTQEQVEELERTVAGWPAGALRREGRALVATAWADLGMPLRAYQAHEAWLAEPDLPDMDWRRATVGLAQARADRGDVRGSVEALERAGLGATLIAQYLKLEALRRWARPVSLGAVAAFLGAGVAVTRLRGLRQLGGTRWWPLLLGAGWVLAIPLEMARRHRHQTWDTFVLLVPLLSLLLAASWVFGRGLPSPGRALSRRVLVSLTVAAHVGALYLALDGSDALLGVLLALGWSR